MSYDKNVINNNYKGQQYKYQDLSRKSNVFFKDIDLDSSLKILNGHFFIEPPSCVIVIKNVLNKEELMIDEEYKDIKRDMIREAEKFGKIRSIKIPRPKEFDKTVDSMGCVFIEFDNVNFAIKARKVF